MIHIADSDKVLLDALSHRNALILSHLPDIPLLFAGRINTVMERILRGIPERPADISCRLLKVLKTQEKFRIDDNEEMAEADRLLASVRGFVRDVLHKDISGKRSGQDLNDRSIAVALIPAHLVPRASERCKGCGPVHEHFQDLIAVCQDLAVPPDDHSRGCRFALSRIVFDLAALYRRSRTVQNEREFLIRRKSEGQRVRSHHIVDAVGRRDRRTGIRSRNSDQTFL